MGVFEMHNLKKALFWCGTPNPHTSAPKHATGSVFGYPVWVCLKCKMPKNVRFWQGAPDMHTSAPNMPPTVFFDT